MTAPTFTKSEALRRLRKLSMAVKSIDRECPRNGSVEIGSRTVPVRSMSFPDVAIADGDDLLDFWPLADAATRDDVTGPGMVVHLYFSAARDRFGDADLVNVITAWMGTADADPELIHVPGFTIRSAVA